jgi:WD40 repeat protein
MHDRRRGVVLRIEDAAQPSRRVLLTGKKYYSQRAAISPDGRLIATWPSSPDRGARAWRLPPRLPRAFPGRRRKRKPFARLTQDSVTCVAFSADSSLIFTGMADGTVRTWDAATGAKRPTPALTGHGGPVAAIAASADGSTIATASGDTEASGGDGTVRVWDADTGQAVATLAALPGGGHAAWFPDGSYRADDSTGALWWAIKLCRSESGEVDPYLPALRRCGKATPSPPSA